MVKRLSNKLVRTSRVMVLAAFGTATLALPVGAADAPVSLSSASCVGSTYSSPFGAVRADLAIGRNVVKGSQTLVITPLVRSSGAVAGSSTTVVAGQSTATVTVQGDGIALTPLLDLEVRKSGALISTIAVNQQCGIISATPQSPPVASYKDYGTSVTVSATNPGVATDSFTFYLESVDGTYVAAPVTWNVQPGRTSSVNYKYAASGVEGLLPGGYKATVVGTYGEDVVYFEVGSGTAQQ